MGLRSFTISSGISCSCLYVEILPALLSLLTLSRVQTRGALMNELEMENAAGSFSNESSTGVRGSNEISQLLYLVSQNHVESRFQGWSVVAKNI